MADKTKDLSPKSHMFASAEQEVVLPTMELPMGQRIGGVSMFGDSFKRGSGDKIFGASNDGIWLGNANFEDAPFSVDMDGNVIANSITLASSTFIGSSSGLNQAFTSGAPGSNVSGASFNITITGSSKIILVVVNCTGYVALNTGGTPYLGRGFIALTIDGSQVRATNLSGGVNAAATDVTGYGVGSQIPLGSAGLNYLSSLAAGTHTINLLGGCDQVEGSSKFILYSYDLSFLTVGNA